MATTLTAPEKDLLLDEDGYLMDLEQWSVGVAEWLARREGMGDLSAEHWKLIAAIRCHYERHGVSPLCRSILKETGLTKKDMYRLFPAGHIRGAYKLAGLPKPAGCN